jgi:hypothetical protein
MGSHSRLKIIMPDEPHPKPAPAAEARLVSAYELRPMAQARRIPLIEREIREHLSQAALDAVFAQADVISEGEATRAGSRSQFLGSTMLTFDVATLAELVREPADEGTARRLASLLAQEKSLDARIETVVRREVERITRQAPRSVRGETRIRTQGTRVFLDVDVEAMLP